MNLISCEKPLPGSFVPEVFWIIAAMQDSEINTCRFQMRRKGFHYYYFLWYNKNYYRSFGIKRYWRNEKFQIILVGREVKNI